MSRFLVQAKAIPRTIEGNSFRDYWSAGFHWSGEEGGTTRELNEEQLAEVQKHQKENHPIKILKVVEIVDEPVDTIVMDTGFTGAPQEPGKLAAPPTTTQAPSPTTTLPVSNVVKPPWAKT